MSRHFSRARVSPTRAASDRARRVRSDRRVSDPIRIELHFLPGLADVVAAEVAERLAAIGRTCPAPCRDDALLIEIGSAEDLGVVLGLRTIVAAYLLLRFDVPRPKSLSSPDRLAAIARAVASAQRLSRRRGEPIRSFRIDAAGRESPVFRALAERIGAATGLAHVPDDGDCVLRFRRSAEAAGWEVLVRLSARPLSSRTWRVSSFPGAVNATVAAAAVRLSRPRPGDRVLNLMCGSGTLLAERLLAGPAAAVMGVDRDPDAIQLSAATLAAAEVGDAVRLETADISTLSVKPRFDVVFACPPWGDKVDRHEDVDRLQDVLLDRAYAWTDPGARMIVISHRVRAMARSLAERRSQWRQLQQTRVWTKGHHPRLYCLRRR